jgi:hypothetical protein
MKIKYYLVECPITPDPNDRRAQIGNYEVVTEKEIFEYITRIGAAITMAEAKANYEEIIGAFDYFLKQGYGINTEFIHIRPVIPGLFQNDDDRFDYDRHKIKFSAQLGKRYNHTADDVKVEKIEAPNNLPLPATFEDIASATVNNTMTPNGVASLRGLRLNFNQDELLQGIFLIDSRYNEYRIERILSHKGTHIVFQLPDNLVPDEYTLEVRMLRKGSKTVRKGKLSEKLTV